MAAKNNSGLFSFDETERDGWVKAQKIAFTAWTNYQLDQSKNATTSLGLVKDLFSDLSSGVLLIQLLEFLSGKPCPKRYSTNPKMKVQCTDNLGIFMDFMKDLQIRTENIGPQDIYEGNQNIILGLIWTLILRFGGGRAKLSPSDQPASDTSDSASAAASHQPSSATAQHSSIDKNALLEWCNQRCNPYGVLLDNFTSSWADGRAFSALASSLTPLHQFSDDIPSAKDSLQESFDHVQQAFAVPQMLVPELMVSPYSPDERSVITYLSAISARCEDIPPIAPPDSALEEAASEPLEFDVSGDGLKDGQAGSTRTISVSVTGDGANPAGLRLRVVGEDGKSVAVSTRQLDANTLEFSYTGEQAGALRVEGYYEDEMIFEKQVQVSPAPPHRFELTPLQDVAKVGAPAEYKLTAFDAFSNEIPFEDLSADLVPKVTLQDHPDQSLPATLTVCDGEARLSFLPTSTGLHALDLQYQGKPAASGSILARQESKQFNFTSISEAPRVSEPCECRLRQTVGGEVVALEDADLSMFKIHTSAPVTDLKLSLDPQTGELVCTCTPVEKGDLEIRVLYDGALAAASTVSVLASPPVSFQFETADEAPAIKQKLGFEIVAQDVQSNFTDFDTTKVGLIITDPQGNTVAHEFDPSQPIADSLSGSFTPLLAGEYTARVFYNAAEISSVTFTIGEQSAGDGESPSSSSSLKKSHRKRHRTTKKRHTKRHSKHSSSSSHREKSALSTSTDTSSPAAEPTPDPAPPADSGNRNKAKLLRVYFGDDPVSQMATLSHTFKSVPYTADTTCSEILDHIVKLIKKVLPITQHPELIRTLNNLTYSLVRVRGDSAVCIPASHLIQDWIERIISEEADLKMRSLISHEKQSSRPALPSQPTADALPDASHSVLLKKALKSKAAAKFLLTQPRRVTVTLEAGRSLASKDSNGKSDPYCKMLLNNQQFTSSVVSSTLDPVWKNQTFEFGVRNLAEAEFYLEVWDHDLIGSHDFMGFLSTDLANLQLDTPMSLWIPLKPRQGKNDLVSGEIKLTFLYSDAGSASSQTDLEKQKKKKHASGVKLSRKQTSQLAAQQAHRLVVTVMDGKDLVIKDGGSASEPYVSVEVFHQTFKTKHVDKTVNPVWNEVLTFGVPELHSGIQLVANVHDAVGKHSFLGQLVLPLGELQGGESQMSGYYQLQPRPGRHDRVSGQIQLKIEYQKDLEIEPQTKIFFAPAPQIPFSVSTTYPSLKVKVGEPILIRLELRMVADKSLCDNLFGGDLCGVFTQPDGSEISVPASKSPSIVSDLDRAKEAGKFYIKFLPTMPGKLTSIVRFNDEPMQRKSAVFQVIPGKRTVNIR